MRPFAQNDGRQFLVRPRVSLSRREREVRDSTRVLSTILCTAFLALAVILFSIAPRDRPVVVVYMHSDCSNCRAWMAYLAARGFAPRLGTEADWPMLRARFALPPNFLSSHTAVVDGLLIEGPVPAGDIHLALRWRSKHPLRGLVVPGVPAGSPGAESLLPVPYTVFAVGARGNDLQPFILHNH